MAKNPRFNWKRMCGWVAIVVVLNGVTIGTGVIVAAGAVVTKSIPPKRNSGWSAGKKDWYKEIG